MELKPPPARRAAPTGRISVLEFLTNFEVGGTEKQLLHLVRKLDRRRFVVHVACFARVGPLAPAFEGLDLPLSEYRIGRLLGLDSLRQQLRLIGYIRNQRIQLVHAHGFYPNVFGLPAARLGGAGAAVAGIRDTLDHLTPLKRRVLRRACGLARRVVVNSEAVERRLVAEGYDRRGISVIRNGLELAAVKPRGQAPALRRELGLPPHAPVVAMVSRLSVLKGIEYFLDAAQLLAPRFPEVRFVLVGGSAEPGTARYRAELEARAGRLLSEGRLAFTGFRADVFELLSEVDVSVLPSLSEGLPNVLLESMAAGVPVVATRVGGTPELVEDGVSGFLVPPRDGTALAQAISRLLESPRLARSMGERGRERVFESFSLQGMVSRTEALYESLFAPCRPQPGRHGAVGAQA